MTEILLHPTTRHQLTSLLQTLPHAVIIHGSDGTGKKALAHEFIAQILGKQSQNSPYMLSITPENGHIGIEQVRNIRDFLKRKTTGSIVIRRVIVISDSHCLTTEAQNALLKTLEEPPKDTIVILTADDPTKLKQTIRSRAQQLIVLPISLEDAQKFYTPQGHEQKNIVSAYYMSDGRAGLLGAILTNSTDHELVRAIKKAKQLLEQSKYERLAQLDTIIKSKENLMINLSGLERIIMSGLRQAADKNNADTVRKFYTLSNYIEQTKQALLANGNPKLVLTKLFINM